MGDVFASNIFWTPKEWSENASKLPMSDSRQQNSIITANAVDGVIADEGFHCLIFRMAAP
jgi:hypothetical protein